MTIREKKIWLSRYRDLEKSIHQRVEELTRLRNLAEKVNPCLSDMPKTHPQNSRMALIVEKIIEIEDEIKDEIDKLKSMRQEIINAINTVTNPKLRSLLRQHYIAGYTLHEIACQFPYNYDYVRKMHRQALIKVKIQG